ncbi:MAG TPA: MFS transporter [Longimicrobiaceae bacterium]|nr:MFS transporter [Longimicrobiaceae bacterium]
MTSPPSPGRQRPHYAWIVAGVTFLTLLAAAGVRSAPGVLIVPLEAEFGWSRATLSLAVSVNLVLYGLMGPFAATIMDRLGVRRTMLASLAVTAAGVAATSLMREPWQLVLLWGVVVGGGTGMTALVLGATVASRWFHTRRGLVMGVLTASTATGQLVFLPAMARLVESSGWRAAVVGIAAVGVVVLPLVALLMRDSPREVGLAPYGGTEADAVPERGGSNPAAAALAALRDGLRSRDFLLLAATFFICGASTNGLIGTHLVPAAHDHGIPEVAAAGLLAAMGVFDFVGTTLSGWLSDRWDPRRLLAWYYGLRGASLALLPAALAGPEPARWAFAVFYGLDWIATVPPTVRLTAGAFGTERVGVMFGWVVAAHQLGAATAAFGAGLTRTTLGDYGVAFWAAGALCAVAAALALRVGRTPRVEAAPVPAPVAVAGD